MTIRTNTTFSKAHKAWILASVAVLALAACDEGGKKMALFQPKATQDEGGTAPSANATRLVERDVEAPDVFQVTEAGLWDGRPSLGGVWVAHSDVKDPERVIIRNSANNKFVIGALFRRERENPGPKLQISSDAAAALGLLAGQPAQVNVTALRREEVPQAEPDPEAETIAASAKIEEKPLAPIAKTAAAAIATAEAAKPEAKPAAAPKPPAKPVAKPAKGGLDKPWIQLGIFSVEANANATASKMKAAGIVPVVKKQTSQGKTFWRVIVGPAGSKSEREALLKQIKAQGFSDAYAVTN